MAELGVLLDFENIFWERRVRSRPDAKYASEPFVVNCVARYGCGVASSNTYVSGSTGFPFTWIS